MAKISKSSSNYFLSYMQTQIDSLKAMNRFGTAANYERAMRSFSEFMKGKDVSFRFFNESLVERYNSYLVHKKLSRNSVSFYMRVLRAVYNKAVRQRLTKQSNPFENVYTGIDKTRKRSVGEFVISKLYKMKLSHDSSLELARDVFIFSFLTRGMSFVDIAFLKKNSIQDGKVVLGLSNGTLINARLDASMQLLQGQSMFFQVKSNNGETIAIRPYTVDGNGVNLTLLNALNAAGLPVTDKYLNLANNMMHEQMPIDKNTMNQMARILMANPDMSVNTLVQMKKHNIPITNEMVAQFENYVDDSSAVHKALDSFITELPTTMAGKDMPLEQLKAFDSQLLMIIADGMEGTQPNGVQSAVSSQTFENPALGENVVQLQQISGQEGKDQTLQMTQVQDVNTQQVSAQDANSQKVLVQEWFPNQMFSQEATPETAEAQGPINENVATQRTEAQTVVLQGENVIVAENAIVDTSEATGTNSESIIKDVTTQTDTKENVVRLMNSLFGELGISDNDSSAVMLNKLSHFILTSNTVSKEALQELFSSKDMQQFLVK